MSKRKLNVKLLPGDTAVVFSYDIFIHIAATYDLLAIDQTDETDASAFRSIADAIRAQADENYFSGTGDYDDDWQ